MGRLNEITEKINDVSKQIVSEYLEEVHSTDMQGTTNSSMVVDLVGRVIAELVIEKIRD